MVHTQLSFKNCENSNKQFSIWLSNKTQNATFRKIDQVPDRGGPKSEGRFAGARKEGSGPKEVRKSEFGSGNAL